MVPSGKTRQEPSLVEGTAVPSMGTMVPAALVEVRLEVVMATAHSLRELKDNSSAYAVYYDVLTGGRKAGGLVAKQLDTLHDPKEMTRIGAEVGMGYVPFVGIGWDAWRYTHKKDPNPVRAVAARSLAQDPDPATGLALVEATKDKDWIVRAAASSKSCSRTLISAA